MSATSGLPRIAAAALALLATGCPPNIPEPDACDAPGAPDGLTALELGDGTADSVFEPWQDGQSVPIIVGSQGGSMIGMRMRLVGDRLPDCFAQVTAMRPAGAADAGPGDTDAGPDELGVTVDVPLHAYPQDDGSLVTRTLFLIFDFGVSDGDAISVETTVGAVVAARTVHVVSP